MKKILLLVASCVLVACNSNNATKVTLTNPLAIDRVAEVIEIPLSEISSKVVLQEGESYEVKNDKGEVVLSQISYDQTGVPIALLIQATVPATKQVDYTIGKAAATQVDSKVYGRFVPERKDDYTWENDKVAFRVYGPTLEKTGEISNGIDIWVKCTPNLVIDKWYANDLSGKASYHANHGEGLDFYKVGRTLGAGAMAPFVGDSLRLGNNFTSYKTIDNGPLRTSVVLQYAPYKAANIDVKETRFISLDAGSHLNKVTTTYQFDGAPIPVAAGLITRKDAGSTVINSEKGYAFYAEPEDAKNGVIYTSLVADSPVRDFKTSEDHLLMIGETPSNSGYSYYCGGGWSQGGYPTAESWQAYLDSFAQCKQAPIEVSIR